MNGKVEAIYIAPQGGVPMQKVKAVEAAANAGLCGDRYKERTGYWTGVDECQVTLIEGENLAWKSCRIGALPSARRCWNTTVRGRPAPISRDLPSRA